MTFESLGLDEALVSALRAAQYEHPTDVQARAIPAALEDAGFEFHQRTIGEALSYVTAPNAA